MDPDKHREEAHEMDERERRDEWSALHGITLWDERPQSRKIDIFMAHGTAWSGIGETKLCTAKTNFMEFALRLALPYLPANEANAEIIRLNVENIRLQAMIDAMEIKETL